MTVNHPYPELEIQYNGKYTILANLRQIARFLARPELSILKYIASATGSRPQPEKLAIYNIISVNRIKDAFEKYYQTHVQCPLCHHHQTSIVENEYVRCLACGHQWKIKRK